MQRAVRPEILDSLPHDHPEALRNRREIRLVNAFMGNYRWLEREAARRLGPGTRALELGAGAGDLARRLRSAGVPFELDGLDLCPPPPDWPQARRWWRADLSRFNEYDGYDAVIANLVLHQFDDAQLAAIGARIRASARFVFVAEPARRSRFLVAWKALGALGLGRVSRHDGAVSIRAGFAGDELPRLLGMDEEAWAWECRMGGRGQYYMAA